MTDDLRWAVRYAFLEDLWRDRPRVVVDAGLEAALRERPRARRADDRLDALLDALVPRSPKARTWVAVTDEAVGRELAQTRPGTGFLPRSSFADVVAHRDWAVALVELSALHPDAAGGPRLREQLAERAQEGRTVVVSARAVPGEEDGDAGYAALTELLDELGGGRIYGVYRPPMAAVLDFGEGDEDEGDVEDEAAREEGDGGDDEVALTFDNTLGSQAPAFLEYVGVVGDAQELPEGMTLVELPADAPSVEQSSDGALRAQLLQAQRQAELAAIDRQALLEKVDLLESAQGRLEQQAAELRDQLARAVTELPPAASEAADRLQASLADNQALRWKAQQLERELEAVKARPVDELEAEVAALRAELQARETAAAAASRAEPEGDAKTGELAAESRERAAKSGERAEAGGEAAPVAPSEAPADVDEALAEASEALGWDGDGDDGLGPGHVYLLGSEAEEAAERLRRGTALADLDRLIERVERGGIGALPLRQALVSLRQRLR